MKDDNTYRGLDEKLGAYGKIPINFSDNSIGQTHAPLKIFLMLDIFKENEANDKKYKISFRYLCKNEFKIIDIITIKSLQQKEW